MPRCYNCGSEQLVEESLRMMILCKTAGCQTSLDSCANCQVGPYCPGCQNRMAALDGPTIWEDFNCAVASCRNLISLPCDKEDLENYGFLCSAHRKGLVLTSPTTLETELKNENKSLTTTLNLKARELADLQAEIRALEVKLEEKESSSAWQVKITKLENKVSAQQTKLNLIKNKLSH